MVAECFGDLADVECYEVASGVCDGGMISRSQGVWLQAGASFWDAVRCQTSERREYFLLRCTALLNLWSWL